MRNTAWALIAALLLSASPAFAENGSRGEWELGGFGGYGWVDDYGALDAEDDLFYGGRLGYFLTRVVSLEATAQWLPTESKLDPETDISLGSYRGNLVFNVPVANRFKPFLTVGAGVENTDIDGFENKSEFGWNAGGGMRVYLTPNFSMRADGRWSQVRVDALDETQDNVEAGLGLSVHFGGTEGEIEEPVQTTPQIVNQPPTISCVTDEPEVQAGETVTVTATATDPEGGPVTLNWSSSVGRVSGNGTSATLSFDGATAPSTATVTVRATDDHGNMATSECSVRLVEPPRPEAVSCMAGGFPRNLSRLTNVDKACLDDVVTRLRSDPRAHVVVVGHADAAERSATRIGEQRATAVQAYLVQAGVEGGRITTRSAGSSTLLDTGTDPTAQGRNRRVEVWFVPEGAEEPR